MHLVSLTIIRRCNQNIWVSRPNLLLQEAVRNSPHRHKPLPDVHNLPSKSDAKIDKGRIWTPPNQVSKSREGTPAPAELKIPSLSTTPSSLSPSSGVVKHHGTKSKGKIGVPLQCAGCGMTYLFVLSITIVDMLITNNCIINCTVNTNSALNIVLCWYIIVPWCVLCSQLNYLSALSKGIKLSWLIWVKYGAKPDFKHASFICCAMAWFVMMLDASKPSMVSWLTSNACAFS